MNIDERLEALTRNLELTHREIQETRAAAVERDRQLEQRLAERDEEFRRRSAEAEEEFRRKHAEAEEESRRSRAEADVEFRRRMEEFRQERERSIAASEARSIRETKRIEALLRRAVKMGVHEARQHRARMRELDEKITQLAAAQLITEEKLQRFLQTRSGNGQPPEARPPQ